MTLRFTKMHALGNDFVVFDAVDQNVEITAERARALADRRFGVGCDQVLLLSKPSREGADFDYRIVNSDGGEVGQCGNGARCVAAFARTKGLTQRDTVVLDSLGGRATVNLAGPERATVDLGAPRLEGEEIPLTEAGRFVDAPLEAGGATWPVTAVSVGNPHAVVPVDSIADLPLGQAGAALEHHPLFPRRANVEFVEKVDEGHLRVRVWERGAGATLACGTGAAAAAVAARLWQWVGDWVTVSLDGGDLEVVWAGGDDDPVYLTGPTVTVFDGELAGWPAPRPERGL
jgi:diaminopimelate epimerase